MIHKFTYDGKLVMSLGTKGERGRDAGKLFDRPTDIDWLPDGTFFISDGYGGVRVAKFDKDGKFLLDWGSEPKDPNNPGPNEWNTVHSISISKDRRLFVADRGHHRMQVFDEKGKFLDMFVLGSTVLALLPHDHGRPDPVGVGRRHPALHEVRPERQLQVRMGSARPRLGQFAGPHQFTVDQEGNLYVAEVFNGRVVKFKPKAGADPAKMVGQELRYKAAN